MTDHTPAREKTPWGEFQLKPTHLKTGTVSYKPPGEQDPAVQRAAALTCARNSRDRDDLLLLLDALGLLP